MSCSLEFWEEIKGKTHAHEKDSNFRLKDAAKLLFNKDYWLFSYSGDMSLRKKKFSVQCVSSNNV